MWFVSPSSWRKMISLSSVLIFLVANCLTRATATDDFLTGKPVTVTPLNGTHLSLDYKDAVKIDNYKKVKWVVLDIDVSILSQEQIL